uniref:Uncharacterized protein n=1 Tax=Zonotrichia albicollis TaxID=44394 RepID=A0A8D2M8B5_ZONAL
MSVELYYFYILFISRSIFFWGIVCVHGVSLGDAHRVLTAGTRCQRSLTRVLGHGARRAGCGLLVCWFVLWHGHSKAPPKSPAKATPAPAAPAAAKGSPKSPAEAKTPP